MSPRQALWLRVRKAYKTNELVKLLELFFSRSHLRIYLRETAGEGAEQERES